MQSKPYPSQRRELRQAEFESTRRDTYARGWAPERKEWPLWAKAIGVVLWALIVGNGIGAVLGLFWRHP